MSYSVYTAMSEARTEFEYVLDITNAIADVDIYSTK